MLLTFKMLLTKSTQKHIINELVIFAYVAIFLGPFFLLVIKLSFNCGYKCKTLHSTFPITKSMLRHGGGIVLPEIQLFNSISSDQESNCTV